MAQISLNLSQFKSSGIYTVEIDQSITFLVNPQTIRLVVGFSKQGPFNTPVFCPDIKTARQVFGDIDTVLERKGSFFHRMLFTCLQTGPVFALNLLVLNDDISSPSPDEVPYLAYSVDASEFNGTPTNKLYSSFYNKERFWFPDPNYFLATESTGDKNKLFSLVNLGKTPFSVITRKSSITGYNVTAANWYTDPNNPMPEWMNPDDYISDFFIDVIAVQGDWTNYASLAVDPVFSTYFDERGFKSGLINNQDPINLFTSLSQVTLVASITGCLIPDFVDQNGVPQFIETLINNTTGVTGLFCAVNKEAFDNMTNDQITGGYSIDLVGHSMISALGSQTHLNFLSYNAPLVNDNIFSDVSPSYLQYESPPSFLTYIATADTAIYAAWAAKTLVDGDIIITAIGSPNTVQYLKFFNYTDTHGAPYIEICAYDYPDFSAQIDIAAPGTMYTAAGVAVASGHIDIVSLYGQYNTFLNTIPAVSIPSPYGPVTLSPKQFILAASDAVTLNIGDLFVSVLDDITPANNRLTRVVTKQKLDPAGDTLITCSGNVYLYPSNQVQKFLPLQTYVKELQFNYFEGFQLTPSHLPDGTDSQLNNILSLIYGESSAPGATNLSQALSDKSIITWRYLVDTFDGSLEPMCKWQFANLCRDRGQAMGLLNAPSAQKFINSTDPVFTDAPTLSNPAPLLDTSYIVQGGNPQVLSSFNFGLVDQANGSQYVGYFWPNIVLQINGKNLTIPPSAHVSNLFIQKFISGNPFAIVAGTRRGIISDPNLVGPELMLLQSDRDNLEPYGINPIIKMRGVGTIIYGNDTAYQIVNSALNNLHVRDILITIEGDIEQILQNYVFEFNDASTRLEIKTKVENYLEGVESAGALYNYDVIMDTTNNTPDIIDQNIGIIDVIIEPARGMQKIVNRVTITRTGQIASGGFTLS